PRLLEELGRRMSDVPILHRTAELSTRDLYQLMTRCVSPRPIAFVSTISREGVPNLAPFSYFALGGLKPPSVVFCPVNDRAGTEKDTLQNIREVGEYVIHGVTRDLAERMNQTSAAFPRGVSEFAEVGFTPVPAELVRAPRVAEARLAFECRLLEIVTVGEGPYAGNFIIGEVLLVHLDPSVVDAEGMPDPERLDIIGRMGGDYYVEAHPEAMFAMKRPSAKRP
ncbi:MAG: flavin reductase family protein, partial [Candidatus Eisenbacteria bacterium]